APPSSAPVASPLEGRTKIIAQRVEVGERARDVLQLIAVGGGTSGLCQSQVEPVEPVAIELEIAQAFRVQPLRRPDSLVEQVAQIHAILRRGRVLLSTLCNGVYAGGIARDLRL